MDEHRTPDFRALFESAPGLYLVLSPELNIIAVSDAYLRATMTRRDEIMGRNLFDVFPDNPNDPAASGVNNLRASLQRVLNERKADTMPVQKYDIRRPESEGGGFEERHWSPVNSPVLDASGKLTSIIHRVEDVTEFIRLKAAQNERDRWTEDLQKRATAMEADIFQRERELAEARSDAELLRASEGRFREMADAMPQIVWTARPDGTVDYYNRQWYEFTGAPNGPNATTHDWQQYLHPDDSAGCLQAWKTALESRETYECEVRIKATDDRGYRWFLTRGLPLRNSVGNVVRWYGTCTDIDDFKRASQALERSEARARASEEAAEAARASADVARKLAEAANKAKDEFLAVLSHELRTPLTPVLLTVSLLENSKHLPEGVQDDIQSIRQNVELEARLIDDLLDLTRVTRGKLRLNLETADIHVAIQKAIDISCAERLSDLRIELNAEYHHVRGDPARLQQIFWNILSNAVKFSPPGKPITVRSFNTAEGDVQVDIADQGIGIDKDALPRLFTAFEQGDASRTRRFGGLGLGLAITRALIDAHGGNIIAQSRGRNFGATFRVYLPTVKPGEEKARPAGIQGTLGPMRAALRILLVEDHAGTLSVTTRLLRRLGHQVMTASTVKTALDLAEREEIDLVISDIGLPDGSGHDVMRALNTRYSLKGVPVRGIAVSGFGMDEDIAESTAAGFSIHLTKPVDLERLEVAIQKAAAFS